MASDIRQKTQEAVDALCASIGTCDLAMLADGETGLVLCTDTGTVLSHDALERIAVDARAEIAAPYLNILTDAMPLSVMRIDAYGTTVMLRGATGDEIIVCRCAAIPDRATLDAAALAVFNVLTPVDEVQA